MHTCFSIIIPVYNVARFLRECLDSVLAQSCTAWEAICVDDGSTDCSGAILDEYSAKDKRFKVLHKANGGVSSARNAGLDIASGEWVAFLDGDDVWAPRTLEIAARAIAAHTDSDLIRFDTANFYESGNYPWVEDFGSTCRVEVENVSKVIRAGSVTCFFAGKIYKRGVVDNIRFEPYTVGEDLLFLTQCMMVATKQIYIKAVCYGYRQRLGSASHSGVSLRTQTDRLRYIPRMLQAYDTTDKVVDQYLWRSYANKITEQFYVSQKALPIEASADFWREWRASLKFILGLRKLPRFQRVRMRLIVMFPFDFVAHLLCGIPYKVKKLGLHR